MGVQKINFGDKARLVEQNTNGLMSGTDKVMDLGTNTPVDEELPVAVGTTGQNFKPSGAKVLTTVENGTILNLVPFSADPVAPQEGDIWLLAVAGNTG